jgi:hypothetical protein
MRRTQVSSKHKKDGHSLMYTPAGTGALGTSRLSIISLIISKAKKKATMKNKFNFFLTFFYKHSVAWDTRRTHLFLTYLEKILRGLKYAV